jgi:hypothetical protein
MSECHEEMFLQRCIASPKTMPEAIAAGRKISDGKAALLPTR